MTTTTDTETPTTTVAGLAAIAKTIARRSLGAIKTAIDSALERTETAVPKLLGEEAAHADAWITDHVTGEKARAFLKGALAIAETYEGAIDTLLVAGLVEANHVVDARLDAFHASA